jgi:hypothetical protein
MVVGASLVILLVVVGVSALVVALGAALWIGVTLGVAMLALAAIGFFTARRFAARLLAMQGLVPADGRQALSRR